jgi:acyl-coenzyme A thioesterase PaaI-like protein
MFLRELGFRFTRVGEEIEGTIDLGPSLLTPDGRWPRASVLATTADVLLGILVSASTPSLPLTSDLAVHTFAPTGVGCVEVRGSLVKVGRSLIVGEAHVRDADGQLVAACHAGFVGSPRPSDLGYEHAPTDEIVFGAGAGVTFEEPFDRFLGIEVAERGCAEVARRDDLLQGSDTFQGGVVCAVAEAAATSLLTAPVVTLETRFLSAVRTGAARATATALGEDQARVEVVDVERPHRLAALVYARIPPSGGRGDHRGDR